jgi:hypothetical protein
MTLQVFDVTAYQAAHRGVSPTDAATLALLPTNLITIPARNRPWFRLRRGMLALAINMGYSSGEFQMSGKAQ